MRIYIPAFLLILGLCTEAQTDTEKFEISCVGFYNVENLFDTLDTSGKRDEEFTPQGRNGWDTKKYTHKLDQLTKVISDLGTSTHPSGLSILGLAEVENRAVLEDLVGHPSIVNRNYQMVFNEGPDRRGIDVGLIYNPVYFELESWKSYSLNMADSTFRTRDQLLVTGKLQGERIHIIVAHWPSRSGGQKRSEPNRIAAAQLGRSIIDSLMKAEKDPAIIYMGDLNDDPVNKSLTKYMIASGDRLFVHNDKLYNSTYDLYQKGIGSLAWRDTWNLFDQILLSPAFLMDEGQKWNYHTTRVYNKPYLSQTSGSFKGYPFRTFSGGAWTGGYSDHFPVYVVLKRRVN